MSGKTLRHVRGSSEDDDTLVRDHAAEDLGTSRRDKISTVDARRDKGGKREFERLEREQRVNEDRKVAINSGWFSLPSDLNPEEELDDIAGGQTHRARLDREQRDHENTGYTGHCGPSSTTYSGSKTGRLHSTPGRSTTEQHPPQQIHPARSYTTYKFKNPQAQANGSSNTQTSILSGLDPSLDPARNGYMGKIPPGGGIPPASASNNGKKSKSKPKTSHSSRPPPSASVSRAHPQVHPMFASGSLVINPQPLPVELSSESSIHAYTSRLWAGAPEQRSLESGSTPVAPELSTITQSAAAGHEVDNAASMSIESSDDESVADTSSGAGLEDVYRKMIPVELSKYNSVTEPEFEYDMQINETPSTTPEPSTPITASAQCESIICSPASLIDDEPSHSEVENLPKGMMDLSERRIRAQIQPVGVRNADEHRQALASQEHFNRWLEENRGKAAHKPATNTCQFVSNSFKSRGLMTSKYAS